VADGGALLKLPNDLLRILVEGMLGSEEGGAEQVVRAWLSLRLTCKHLWELIADVPLDLRFSAPLTDAQVCPVVSHISESSVDFNSFWQALGLAQQQSAFD
jgi:hypothetical protein